MVAIVKVEMFVVEVVMADGDGFGGGSGVTDDIFTVILGN